MGTQHVATCAWAFAVCGINESLVFDALADYVKGGRLWDCRPDEVASLFWSFSKIAYSDKLLYLSFAQTIGERREEFDERSIANIMCAAALIAPDADTINAALEVGLDRFVDSVFERLESGTLPVQSEASCMTAWYYCTLGARDLFWQRLKLDAPPALRGGSSEGIDYRTLAE